MTAFFGAFACVSVLKHLGLSHTHLRLQNEIIEHEKSAPVKQWFCQRAAMIPSCATAVWRCSRVRQHGREEHGNDRMDIGTRKMESWRKRKTRPVNRYDLVSHCTAGCHAEVLFQLESISWLFPPKKNRGRMPLQPTPKFPMSSPPPSSTAPSPCRSSSTLIPTHVNYISIYAWLSPYSAFLFCILFYVVHCPFFLVFL